MKDNSYPEEGSYVDSPEQTIPRNWPLNGKVEFRDVCIKYDPEGPDVLKNINLTFHAGERVAIIGRTGSGKSTVGEPRFLTNRRNLG